MYSIFKTFFLSLCIIANTQFAYSQTASILPPAKTTFNDQNGKPLTSGTVDFYIPSTNTRKATWQDASETILNTNPVVLDAAGRALILGSGSYRQVVKDRVGNIIWDQVTSSAGSGNSTSTSTGDGDLVGTIKPWAGLTAPNQYVFTYGQELSRTTYSALFTAITSTQAVFCSSGSPILNGLSDTTNFPIGAKVEISCVVSGVSTIVSKTSGSITLAANSNISTNTSAIIFPWGNGNATTTFNVPDFRGFAIAGNNNMGGVASSVLTTTYFGATNPNSIGAAGGSQSHTLTINELPASPPASGVTTNTLNVATVMKGSVDGGTSSPNFYRWGNDTGSGPTNNNLTPTGTVTVTGNLGGGAAHSIVQPTKTSNYIIKITPDTNSSLAAGVTHLGGMTGDIACGTGLLCTGNIISNTVIVPTQPYVMPSSYGAVCDGVTNDAASLQLWLTAISSSAVTGYIPSGSACVTNSTLIGGSNTTIVGGGIDVATLKGGTGAHPVLSFVNKTNLNLSDFTIASADSITSWISSTIGAVSIVQDASAPIAGTGYRFRNMKFYGFNDNYWIYVNAGTSTFGMSKFEFDNVYVKSGIGDIPTDPTPSNNSNTWLTLLSGSAGNGKIEDVTVNNINIDGTGLCIGHIFYGNTVKYKVQNSRYFNVGATTPGHCINGFGTTNNSYSIAVYDIRSDGNPPNLGLMSNNQIINPYSAGIYFAGDGDVTHTAISYNNFNTLVEGNLISGQSSNSDFTLPRAAIALTNATNIDIIGNRLIDNYGGVSVAAQFSGVVNIIGNNCVTGAGSSVGNPTSCIRLQSAQLTTGGPNYIVKNNHLVVTGDTSRVVRKFADTGYRYGSIDFSNNTVIGENVGADFNGIFVIRGLTVNANKFSGIATASMLDIGSVSGVTIEAAENNFDLNLGTAGIGLIATSSSVNLVNNAFKNRTSGAAYAFSAVGATGTLSGMQFINITTANQVAASSLGLALPAWSASSQNFVQNLAVTSNSILTSGWKNLANGNNWTAISSIKDVALTGSTTTLATATGSFISTNCVQSNASHNLVDAGAPCGTGTNVSYVQDFIGGTDYTAGVTTTLTVSNTPLSTQSTSVYFDGVRQATNTWSLSTATITFSAAIPINTQVVEIASLTTTILPTWVTSIGGLTGALTRTQVTQMVYASDYMGSKTCDGTTDVSTELQSFLTAISANGVNSGSVIGYFPPGVCIIDTATSLTLTINTSANSVNYRLIGNGTTLKPKNTRAIFALFIDRGTLITYQDERTSIYVEDLVIDQIANANASGGILIERANTRIYRNIINGGGGNNSNYAGILIRNPPAHNTDAGYGPILSEVVSNTIKGSSTNMPIGIDIAGTANALLILNNKISAVEQPIITEAMCAANSANCASIANGVVIANNAFESFTYAVHFINTTSLAFSQAVGWQIYSNRAEVGSIFLNLSGLALATDSVMVLGPNMLQSSVTSYINQGATPTMLNIKDNYGQTYATLGACVTTALGVYATVTDSNTVVWGANVAGGGANKVTAFCNGGNWTVAAK